jgi:hypothetical protein
LSNAVLHTNITSNSDYAITYASSTGYSSIFCKIDQITSAKPFTYNPSTNLLKLTGSLILNTTGGIVIMKDLPTTEPTASGQLWVSGSAGSNSKFLCIRD